MITIIKKLLNLLSSKEKFKLLLLFITQVILAFFEMAGIASIMPFMAVVTNPNVIQKNWWLKSVNNLLQFNNTRDFLFFLGIVVLALMIFNNLAKALMTWMTLSYDNNLNYKLAKRLLTSYITQPYAFFLNRNTAEMGKNVLQEVRTVIAGVLSAGMTLLSSALVSFFILALLMAVDIFIAINIILILGISYGLIYVVVRRRLNIIGKDQVAYNAQKYKSASEALTGIKDLKILGREAMFIDKFAFYARNHARNNITAGVISQLPRYALEIIAFGGILMMVLIFLKEGHGSSGHMVPLLALYAFAGYRLLPALQQIFANVATVRFNLAALDVLHQDLKNNRSTVDSKSILSKIESAEAFPFTQQFELQNISFRYSGVKEFVLRNLSLTIPINASIGFVGSTGSGKTTAVDIILGLLSPSSGDLLVDGEVISDDNLYKWQRNLGYVPQTIFLCDDTVAKNIAFGVTDAKIDMEAVVRAARIANLDGFVTKEMPNGYETVIGDRGIRLSGGQRQRIGIARALYNDPSVLIMDEATSSLDGLTEEAVMEAIYSLSKRKTIIMVAHRLTTVRDCDEIYLFQNGRIENQGTYEQLQKSSEWFRAAVKSGSLLKNSL